MSIRLLLTDKTNAGFGVIQGFILIFIVFLIGMVTILAYTSARGSARDAKRISDITQLQKALKYYHEEFGYYPQASNGIAVGFDGSFSRFVSSWPNAPLPADGLCSAEHNRYFYEQINSGETYQIRFCLGGAYGPLKAGVRLAKPGAIE